MTGIHVLDMKGAMHAMAHPFAGTQLHRLVSDAMLTRDTPRSRRSVEEAAAPQERRVGLSRPLFLRTDPQTAPRRSMPAHEQNMQRA